MHPPLAIGGCNSQSEGARIDERASSGGTQALYARLEGRAGKRLKTEEAGSTLNRDRSTVVPAIWMPLTATAKPPSPVITGPGGPADARVRMADGDGLTGRTRHR